MGESNGDDGTESGNKFNLKLCCSILPERNIESVVCSGLVQFYFIVFFLRLLLLLSTRICFSLLTLARGPYPASSMCLVPFCYACTHTHRIFVFRRSCHCCRLRWIAGMHMKYWIGWLPPIPLVVFLFDRDKDNNNRRHSKYPNIQNQAFSNKK